MKIIMLHNSTMSQMMGFIIVTKNGKIIAVDGGTDGDTAEFKRLAAEHGGHIDMWFLTHPHHDHHDVFAGMSERKDTDITVGCVYYCPTPDSFIPVDPAGTENDIKRVMNAFEITPYPLHVLREGEAFDLDNVHIDILRVFEPDIGRDEINNLSVAFKLDERISDDKHFKMIFMGDLGVRGGEEMLEKHKDDMSVFRADAVQMAHHGQNGVDLPVYKAISPRYAFWPTPDWLWTNTPGGWQPGTGPWKTLEVRAWMEELGTKNITAMQEHAVFDTEEA